MTIEKVSRSSRRSAGPGASRHPLAEPAHFYDPPYDHPAADALAWYLTGTLRPEAALKSHAVVLTPHDCFRVDFLIEQALDGGHGEPLRIGVLCGPEDAEGGALAEPDLYDALLVGTGAVDALYRFRPEDVRRQPFDVLYLMAAWDGALFGGRKRAEIVRRASSTMRCYEDLRPDHGSVRLSYPSPLVEVVEGEIPERPAGPVDFVARRWSRRYPAAWTRAFERALRFYDLAEGDASVRWAKSA